MLANFDLLQTSVFVGNVKYVCLNLTSTIPTALSYSFLFLQIQTSIWYKKCAAGPWSVCSYRARTNNKSMFSLVFSLVESKRFIFRLHKQKFPRWKHKDTWYQGVATFVRVSHGSQSTRVWTRKRSPNWLCETFTWLWRPPCSSGIFYRSSHKHPLTSNCRTILSLFPAAGALENVASVLTPLQWLEAQSWSLHCLRWSHCQPVKYFPFGFYWDMQPVSYRVGYPANKPGCWVQQNGTTSRISLSA